MADYPLNYGEHNGLMASEVYKKKSYTKWVLGLPTPTGPVFKFKKYFFARNAASSSPEPPAPPGASPSSPVPPTTPPPSPAPSGADSSLLHKLDHLERKVDAMTELVLTGEEPPSATVVTPDVTPEVPEASTLATLA